MIRAVARWNRLTADNGRQLACVGAYAEVERPGPIAVGDDVRL